MYRQQIKKAIYCYNKEKWAFVIKIIEKRGIVNLYKSFSSELFQGSFYSFTIRIAGLLFGYLFSFAIARIYGASVLGEFIIAYIIIDLSGIVISLGLETRVVALVSKYSSQGRSILNPKLLRKVHLIIITAGLILIGIYLIFQSRLMLLFSLSASIGQFAVIMMAAVIPLALLRINAQYARGLKQIKRFAIYNYVLDYFPAILLLILLRLFFESKSIVAIAYASAAIIGCLVSLIPNLAKYKAARVSYEEKKELGSAKLLTDSFPLLISELMNFAKQWSGIIFIAFYLHEQSVGIFSMAFKLASVPGLILIAVNNMAMPLYGENIGKNNWYEIRRLLLRTFKILFLTAIPVTLLIIIFGRSILLLIGSEFKSGYIVLVILLFGQFLEILSGSVGSLLLIADKQKVYNNIVMADTGILILVSFLLLPVWGMNGVAIAIGLSSGFRTLLQVFYLKYRMSPVFKGKVSQWQ